MIFTWFPSQVYTATGPCSLGASAINDNDYQGDPHYLGAPTSCLLARGRQVCSEADLAPGIGEVRVTSAFLCTCTAREASEHMKACKKPRDGVWQVALGQSSERAQGTQQSSQGNLRSWVLFPSLILTLKGSSLPPVFPQLFLTLHFKVHGLGILANGVAGSADILSSVRVLDALQSQGRHAGMAAHHHVPVQSLPGGKGEHQSPRQGRGPCSYSYSYRRLVHHLSVTNLTSSLLSGPTSKSDFRYHLMGEVL